MTFSLLPGGWVKVLSEWVGVQGRNLIADEELQILTAYGPIDALVITFVGVNGIYPLDEWETYIETLPPS